MGQQSSNDVKKHVRSLRLCLGIIFVSGICFFGMGMWQEGRTATLFYAAAIGSLAMCLVVIWILSLAKKKSTL